MGACIWSSSNATTQFPVASSNRLTMPVLPCQVSSSTASAWATSVTSPSGTAAATAVAASLAPTASTRSPRQTWTVRKAKFWERMDFRPRPFGRSTPILPESPAIAIVPSFMLKSPDFSPCTTTVAPLRRSMAFLGSPGISSAPRATRAKAQRPCSTSSSLASKQRERGDLPAASSWLG